MAAPLVAGLPREGGSLSPRALKPDYVIDPATGCWEWQKFKTRLGYGQGNFTGAGIKTSHAHRAYWIAANGEPPEGFHIHHKCENPSCVNPEHLEPRDPVTHLRRHWRTWQHRADGRVPATPDQIEFIKQWVARDPRAASHVIAAEVGLLPRHVRCIINGRTWAAAGEIVHGDLRCVRCGGEITDYKRRTKRYCSEACKTEANRAA